MVANAAVLEGSAGELVTDADFVLDVEVITDGPVGYLTRGCDSSDGCGSTCASACASN